MAVGVYSFTDCQGAIVGPGGSFTIGSTAGVAGEGLVISMVDDKDSMSTGADGTAMHSLHASTAGTITIRLQKTSPVNAQLSQMYLFQTTSSANHAQNTISIRDPVRGDTIAGTGCAFKKFPDVTYAIEGGSMEWVFNCSYVNPILGNGNPG
jgi:hypothetical protein